MPTPAAAELPIGWGSPALRRATLALAATQLVSWGVVFYGFAVVAPEITADVGLSLPLASIERPALFVSAAVVGAASGATTVLRPLLVVELVGAAPYAAVSAHLQRATTVARAGAPLALGAGVAAFGWPLAWTLAIATFGAAAAGYLRLGDGEVVTPEHLDGCDLRPGDVTGV